MNYEGRAAAFRSLYKDSVVPPQLFSNPGIKAEPLNPPLFSDRDSSWAARTRLYMEMYTEEAPRSVGNNGTSRYWAAKVQPTLFEIAPVTEESAAGLLLTVLPKPLAQAIDTELKENYPEIIRALQEQWTIAGPRIAAFMRRNPNQAKVVAFLVREFGTSGGTAVVNAGTTGGPGTVVADDDDDYTIEDQFGGEGNYVNEEYSDDDESVEYVDARQTGPFSPR